MQFQKKKLKNKLQPEIPPPLKCVVLYIDIATYLKFKSRHPMF